MEKDDDDFTEILEAQVTGMVVPKRAAIGVHRNLLNTITIVTSNPDGPVTIEPRDAKIVAEAILRIAKEIQDGS